MVRSDGNGDVERLAAPTSLSMPMGEARGAPADSGPSPLAMIDDRLRGRWKPAIGIGVALGALAAVLAFVLAPIKYQSTGTIRVIPIGSPILRESAETDAVPRYENVIKTQAVFVQTPRVIQQALDDDEVRGLDVAQQDNRVELIADGLRAEAVHQTELVSVSYVSTSAREAQTIVNAVLRAYEEIHGSQKRQFRSRRENLLEQERAELRRERSIKRQAIHDHIAASTYGGDNLDQVLGMKLVRIEELQQEMERLELALSLMEGSGEEERGPVGDPTPDELDAFDDELAVLRRAVGDQRIALERLRTRYNDSHLIVRRAAHDLATAAEQLEHREQEVARLWRLSAGGLAPLEAGDIMNEDQMKRQAERIRLVIERNRKEVRSLNEDQARLADLQTELGDLEVKLDEIDETLRVLKIESDATLSGHIEIAEWGVLPRTPANDKRIPLAVVAFGGGLAGSLAFFFLLGSIDRRAYSANQLRNELTGLRCLGVLPDLGQSGETELSETAAQCVHQIRNRIEAQRRTSGSFQLVITSPYQGDGKTSLTMALGWSYAAAGYRTLLVDGDLYGQSLTYQLGAAGNPGLREVLRDRSLKDEVIALPVPNLFVLGAGLDARIGPESIRRDDFEMMTRELRRDYDVILVDTGPAIGSVELFPIASSSDGVAFSVRRGRSRSSIDVILEDLAAMHVHPFGVILNCADHADCERYVSKSTVSKRIDPVMAARAADDPGDGRRCGDRNQLVRAIERAAEVRDS